MDEIGMQAVLAGIYAVEERMRIVQCQSIPANLRDLQVGVRRDDFLYVAFDPAKALGHIFFKSPRRHQLHSNTNAQIRAGLDVNNIADRGFHARDGQKTPFAIGIGANARQNNAIGRSNPFRIGRQLNFRNDARFAGRALKRLRCGSQIPRSVINNGNTHRSDASVTVEYSDTLQFIAGDWFCVCICV